MDEPLSNQEAQKLVRAILKNGTVYFAPHSIKAMADDGLAAVDVENVLRAGWVEMSEYEKEWIQGSNQPYRSHRRFRVRGGADGSHGVEVLMVKRCRSCGGVMEQRSASRQYDESGLQGIVLVGVPVRKCSECGEETFGIPKMWELHRLIALTLVRKTSGLTGMELRFLRKHLGYSGVDLAERLDVTPEHLSRWENDAAPMSAMAERLIRLMVVHNDRAADYSLDDLKETPRGKPVPLRLKVRLDESGWQTAA